MQKLFTFFGLALLSLLAISGRAETVTIHHVGVGQGDGTLIVVTNDKKEKASILIDAGNSSSKGQAMLTIVDKYLSDVKRVDFIITSHLHSDHLGGMPTVIQQLASNGWKIGLILDRSAGNYLGDDSCYTEVTQDLVEIDNDDAPPIQINKLIGSYHKAIDGAWSSVVGGWRNYRPGYELFTNFLPNYQTSVRFRCLASNGFVCNTASDYNQVTFWASAAKNENDYSFAYLLELNGFTYFTGGDIGGDKPYVDLETPLVSFFKTRSDADTFHFCSYKASHHGSLHSTNQGFVSFTKPTLTIVPSALRSFSGTKLPGEATLKRLDAVPSLLAYTYLWGSGSSRSSGSVTAYQDVALTVDGATYAQNHQIQVCVATRDKKTLALNTSTTCNTVTCNRHGSTQMLSRAAATPAPTQTLVLVPTEQDATSVSDAPPSAQRQAAPMAAPVSPAPPPAPAAATAKTSRGHLHLWPWRWFHRHSTAQ